MFINPDPAAPSLADYVGELGDHFAGWPLEDRFVQVHVAKVLRCNWKVAQEAFMEAMHVVATHPQILPSIGDANSQYDVFGNFSRAITANGTPSPHLKWQPTEQEMLDSMYDRNLDEPPVLTVPEGRTAREVAAENRRNQLRPVLGADAEKLSDAEVNDSFYFTLFPNFHPWGAFNRIVYRFRPNGMSVDEAIMECMFLSPFPTGERPPPAPIHWLDADSDWTKAPQLGSLARVFNQDSFNLPNVHLGLKASPTRARHVRPLRGVEDPPLAHAPRGAPRPTVIDDQQVVAGARRHSEPIRDGRGFDHALGELRRSRRRTAVVRDRGTPRPGSARSSPRSRSTRPSRSLRPRARCSMAGAGVRADGPARRTTCAMRVSRRRASIAASTPAECAK